MIVYLHHYPQGEKIGIKYFHNPMPIDSSGCGYYSDRIYNMHGATKRFYIATFGYEKAWKEHNTYEREIDRFIIHFVFDGRGSFNGQPVSAGQMYIAPQNQKYTIIQDSKQPMTFGWIALSGTELENQISLLHLSDLPVIAAFQNEKEIHDIFVDTVYGPYSNLDLEMFMFSAFFKIMSLCNIVDRPSPSKDVACTDLYFSEIMSFINTHYSENISVADIAKHVHISAPYLRRICTQKAEKSPQELINQKRMSVAKSMLANSNATVGEISMFVGFSSQNTFSKFFTKHCGISAQAYRQQQIETRKRNAENIARTENNWRSDEERRLQKIREERDNNV